jgi:hypothetical protein
MPSDYATRAKVVTPMIETVPDYPAFVPTEEQKAESWRFETLLGAGYTGAQAEELARNRDVDLHRAVGLLERGCAPATALAILA